MTIRGAARRRKAVGALTVALVVCAAGCSSGTSNATETSVATETSIATETSVVTETSASTDTSDTSVASDAEAPGTAAQATITPEVTMEPGDITETVPAQATETAPAVGIDETAALGAGVTAEITKVVAVDTKASRPGEIAGPGVALTVRIVNGSANAIDLGATLVDLVDAEGRSATQMVQGTQSLTGSLAPGESMLGTYVFTIDEALRRDVAVQLSYTTDEPTVVFTGNLTGQE